MDAIEGIDKHCELCNTHERKKAAFRWGRWRWNASNHRRICLRMSYDEQGGDRSKDNLSKDELDRYSRQIVLGEIGIDGQRKLKRARVLIVGLGGLGSPLALYLAAAGVGTIGIVDDDTVHLSNLHRQILYGTDSLGEAKVAVASKRMRDLNPDITVIPHQVRLSRANAIELLTGYDIVADATDNFAARYLISDACVLSGIPDVCGSVFTFEGHVTILSAKGAPCYRCIFPSPPGPTGVPSCNEIGVLGVLPGIVGSLQAAEVLKLILGIGQPLIGRMMLFDALGMAIDEVSLMRNIECPMCGDSPTIHELPEYESFCGTQKEKQEAMTVEAYSIFRTQNPDHILLDVREPWEREIADIGGSLIPLGELQNRLGELPNDKPIIALCHHGVRSRSAVTMLQRAGFENAVNLDGGIAAWSERIDRAIPQY